VFGYQQMTGAGDGQEFGDALDYTQGDRIDCFSHVKSR